jgi:Tfp pilus assembly protein PilF
VAELRKALDRDPKLPAAHNVWGLSLYDRGQYLAAANEFRVAVKLAPDDAVMQSNLADALYLAGERDAAQDAVNAALKADPKNARAHNVQGDLLLARGEYERAEIYYRAAVGLAPDDWGMRADLAGVTQRRLGEGRQASVDDRQDRPPRR